MNKILLIKSMRQLAMGVIGASAFISPAILNAQLSGSSYTIDNTISASSSNYTDFQSLFNDIAYGFRNDGGTPNGPDVSGNVTVNVKTNSTFTEQVTVYPASSMDSNNRVTIKGNNALLTFNATNPYARHTLWLQGASYFTFENLRVEGTNASYVHTVRLSDYANYNFFTKCTLSAPKFNYSGTVYASYPESMYNYYNGYYAGAVVAFTDDAGSLNAESYYYAQNGRGNRFEDNLIIGPPDGSSIIGPSYGIFEQGGASSDDGENEFIGNTIKNFSAVGIYSFGCSGGKYNNNDITRNLKSPVQAPYYDNWLYGIDIRWPDLSAHSDKDIEIIGNNIHDIGDPNRGDGAGSFCGINVSALNGCEYCYNLNYGPNIIRIENNRIVNNVAGNDNYPYCNMYGISTPSASSTFIINNIVANNGLYNTSLGYGYVYPYDIYKIYSSGDVVNNTFFFNKKQASGVYYYGYNYLYCYGVNANQANPPIQSTTRVENNIFYYDLKGVSGGQMDFDMEYISSIRNNDFYFTNMPTNYTYLYAIGSSFSGYYSTFDLSQLNSISSEAKGNIKDNPTFVDPINLNLTFMNPALKSAGYDYKNSVYSGGIDKDIDGVTRNPNKPSIGAIEPFFEFMISGDFNGGNYNVCGGEKLPMTGTVKNTLSFDFPNGKVGYILNNKPPVITNIGTLGALTSTSFDLGLIDFTGAPQNTILKVFIAHTDDNHANDTLTFNIQVGRGAYGGVITINTSSMGREPDLDEGRDYWITIPDDVIKLDISAPTDFTNAQYGTGYKVTTNAYTLSGINLPASATTYTHSPITGGTWSINPPEAFVDSFIIAELHLINISTDCDSIVRRKIFVAPFGKPDFKDPHACMGAEAEFENFSTVQSGYLTYEWDFGNGETSTNTNGKTKFLTPGTYQVTLKTTTVPLGFVKSKTKSITIFEGPIADFTYESKCFGTPVTLTNTTTSNVGVPNYTWDFGDGQTSNLANPTINYASKGLYVITLIAEKNGCSSKSEQTIAMFEQPVADFIISNDKCANHNIVFSNNASNISGKTGYLWSFGENNAQSTQLNGEYSYNTAGDKNVKLVVQTALGCKDSIIKLVSITPGPTGDFSIVGECQDADIVLTSTDAALSGTSYTWTIDEQLQSGTNSVTKKYSNVSIHNVTLTTTYTNGCSNSVTKQLEVKPTPKADFVAGGTICSNNEVILENKTRWTDGEVNYFWELGDGNTSTHQHAIHTYTTSGNMNVRLVANITDGCTDEITKTITVNPSPTKCQFVVNYDGTQGLRAYSFEPTDGSNVGAETGITYSWYFGDGYSMKGAKGTQNYNEDGFYKVTMRAETAAGCLCESSQNLIIDRTGVSNTDANSSFNVYPNPSTGIFNIEIGDQSDKGIIEVFDVLGNKLFNYTSIEMENGNWQIDLSAQSNGIYLIRYTSNNQASTKKVRLMK
ncbi:MAG: PKD domain-containing protein [Bacteroidetes bacterium]|nr:PKD domain-containing protein [Bacteroidota bacterium]